VILFFCFEYLCLILQCFKVNFFNGHLDLYLQSRGRCKSETPHHQHQLHRHQIYDQIRSLNLSLTQTLTPKLSLNPNVVFDLIIFFGASVVGAVFCDTPFFPDLVIIIIIICRLLVKVDMHCTWMLFSVCGGWKSKQMSGYFPSATDGKKEHADSIFHP